VVYIRKKDCNEESTFCYFFFVTDTEENAVCPNNLTSPEMW
jgi:hypothetical protein